jgi:vacuolar-type H+-ATPase subunit F/Vma7
MDEKVEKIIELAGNEHRYQYFTLCIAIFVWINCNFIQCVLPFLEREPIVNYTDSDGVFQESVTLTSDICSELDGRDYQVVESFGYSWVSEYHVECKSTDISNIGSFAFIGNSAGALGFSFISKLTSHKKLIIISCFGLIISSFLSTLVKSYTYFYGLLVCGIFMGFFGNCLCFSSVVIAEEIVSNKKRSLFSSLINAGYSLCGIIYTLLFLAFKDWRNVIYVLIGATSLAIIFVWIFVYDSPREYIENKNRKKALEILEGIASFNGKLEDFKEKIKQDTFQELIGYENASVSKDTNNKFEKNESKKEIIEENFRNVKKFQNIRNDVPEGN